jgi:hypothetical protein
MSIATMMRLAAQAEAGAPAADPARRGPQPAGPLPVPAGATIGGAPVSSTSNAGSKTQAALEAIAGYIPSEGLALYIAALGAIQPQSDGVRWLLLGLGVAVVILFATLAAFDRETRPAPAKIGLVTLLAVVSFVTYAAALPGSPFLAIHAQATVIAGVVALFLSYLMPRIAKAANLVPVANG